MKTISVILLALFLTSSALLSFSQLNPVQSAGTIIVPDEYPTIQQAINAATPGDIVYVRKGTYKENLIVNKSVSLIAESQEVVIDGGNISDVIHVTVNSVSIINFTIKNGWPLSGVYIDSCNNTVLRNNTITANLHGIYLYCSSNNTIDGNSVYKNSVNGIYIRFSSNNYLIRNNLTENGILISYGGSNVIDKNAIRCSSIYLESSYNNITENIIENGSGITLRYYGGNRIIGNNLINNSIGIFIDVSPNNVIYHNNFLNNTRQAGANSKNIWDDGYPSGGNYWSDYAGVDQYSGPYQNETGSDGIGDTPYVLDENNVDHYPLMNPWTPTPVYVNGVDVSHWQGSIIWSKVYGAGYRFAFVKASEGVGWVDPNFEANMKDGRNAGLLMGAYHFARPDLGNNPKDEAEYFISVASEYLREGFLRPALDLEVGSTLGKDALSNWVRVWMETVKNETGIEPIIYVNSYYANNYLDVSLAKYELWIAHWTYDPSVFPNTGIWETWSFWQYSDKGSVPGITGNVDLDLFNGNMRRLYSEFTISNLKVLNVTWEDKTYPITIQSNSTVTHLVFNQPQAQISFNVTGPHGSKGYCNITIPKNLLKGPWTYTFEGDVFNVETKETENETHSFISFTYTHASAFQVAIQGTWVIPEFSSASILLLFMLTTLIVIVLPRRKGKIFMK